MQWMRTQGRRPSPHDAALIMSLPLDLSAAADMFGAQPPPDLAALWESDLSYELQAMELFQDTQPTISRLQRAGYQVGLCSNLAAPYGSVVKSLLPKLDCYALSYEVGAVKPDPSIYKHLLHQLNCKASETLFIGDTASADFDGPKANGMQARLIDRAAGQNLDDVLHDVPEKR